MKAMFWRVLAPVALCFSAYAADDLPPAAKSKVNYARDVQPLLAKRCYVCHGPQQQMSGLRLDQKDAALKVIQPGNSAESRIIRMVAGVGNKVMPPVGERLTAAEIGLLRGWIDQGVEWAAPAAGQPQQPTHWSFRKVTRPDPPAVGDRSWARNAIDRFILARLDKEGVKPSPEAPKTTLIRRLSLDLTGLPPTPQEVADFLGDNRPDAYERLVDRLLASPHYGEKWARYWLDLARYADSDGYEKDRSRPWAWRYRQWVIEAMNRDLPFDQFTIEQLAGDLLAKRTEETMIATGFNRNTLTNREGGTDPEQFRDEQVLDRAATLGTVWLGLTVGCAQCHNHKFDPISQKEFYQLTAFFDTQEEVNIPRAATRRTRALPGGAGGLRSAAADAARSIRNSGTAGRLGEQPAVFRATSGRTRGLGLRVRRIPAHSGQREEGLVARSGKAKRSAADRDDRRCH